MSLLTTEIKEFVKTQKLGYVATVCPDGTPNLSPKGTTTVWDEEHLVFLDIHSPGTVSNLLLNPAVEVNVVDIFTRKGYRFKGTAKIFSAGKLFDDVISSYGEAAKKYSIKNIVLINVERVLPLFSPVYDTGLTEDEVVKRWREYWTSINVNR
jgi:predicted pyridoxine 5'-phosphate oxidase superfamily flavin-nucleotide-binding protein